MFEFLKFLKLPSVPRANPKSKESEPLRITVIGPPAGGKSTMLANLRFAVSAAASSAGFRIAFFPHRLSELELDAELPADLAMDKPMTGIMSRGGAKYRVEISDTVGGLLISQPDVDETQPMDQWPEIFRRTVKSDLLIILVDPATLCDRSRLQKVRTAVAHHVSLLVKHKPNAMIALAFTKADEYGIAGPTRFRLMDTPQRLEAFRNWSADLRDGGAQWVSALKTPPDEAVGAIDEIMSRATENFRDLVQVAGPEAVHAYLVTASPIEPPVVPYPIHRRGMVEIFADFFAQTRTRWPRPTVPLWLSGGLFALVALLYGVLSFVVALLIVAVIGGIWLFARSRAR